MLPVSAPFHSSLMQPAAEAMREALAQACAKSGRLCPLLPMSAPHPCPIPMRSQLLVEQVTGQVRWRETVEWFAANGVDTLAEIGAGKVLTGLARRIDRS
jgi:[acyl-carrier-protein] S-malonyltransferase